VVAEDVETDFVVVLGRVGGAGLDPLLVDAELGGDFGRVVADAVEQSVETGPVLEGEVEIRFRRCAR
jgi:hypothetical protein